MFNPLIDTPPDNFNDYPIATSYRVVLEYFRLCRDSGLDDTEKGYLATSLFFKVEGEGPDKALEVLSRYGQDVFEFIAWYISRGAADDESEAERVEKERVEKEEDRVFDILVDSERIFAGFRQAYGIDLRFENMHWWDFLTLLNNIPESTRLSDVMRIRGQKLPKPTKHNGEELERMQKLKRKFLLGGETEEEERMNDSAAAIFGAWG